MNTTTCARKKKPHAKPPSSCHHAKFHTKLPVRIEKVAKERVNEIIRSGQFAILGIDLAVHFTRTRRFFRKGNQPTHSFLKKGISPTIFPFISYLGKRAPRDAPPLKKIGCFRKCTPRDVKDQIIIPQFR